MSLPPKRHASAARLRARCYLFARAAAWLWFSRLALWLTPFSLAVRLVKPTSTLVTSDRQSTQRVVRGLELAARYVPRATCLVRALAGARLLASEGYPIALVIGVRKHAGFLEAHAWLETNGRVVLGDVSDLSSYQPLGSTKW